MNIPLPPRRNDQVKQSRGDDISKALNDDRNVGNSQVREGSTWLTSFCPFFFFFPVRSL